MRLVRKAHAHLTCVKRGVANFVNFPTLGRRTPAKPFPGGRPPQKHNSIVGPLVPKGPSDAHARILSAGIVAPCGSLVGERRSSGQDATSHWRTKSRWKDSSQQSALSGIGEKRCQTPFPCQRSPSNGGRSSLCRLDRGPGRFFCGKAIPSFPWHDGQWARGPSRRNRQPGTVAIITQDTPSKPAGLTPAGSGVSGVEALVRWVLLVIGSRSGVGNQGRAEDPRHPQGADGVDDQRPTERPRHPDLRHPDLGGVLSSHPRTESPRRQVPPPDRQSDPRIPGPPRRLDPSRRCPTLACGGAWRAWSGSGCSRRRGRRRRLRRPLL